MESANLYIWPRPDSRTLLLILIAVVALFALMVLAEWWRRRRERRALIAAEWRVVREIARERELHPDEEKLLNELLAQYAPDAPHKAVTIRQHFDAMVDRYLDELAATADEQALERQGVALRDLRERLGLAYIPIGQRITTTRDLYRDQVLWAANNAGQKEHWYPIVVTAVDEAHFRVAPQHGQDAPALAPGAKVRLRMWRQEDARYEFTAELKRVQAQPPLYVFRHSRDLDRVQEREHFRITHDQPVEVSLLNAPSDGDFSDVHGRDVVTRLRGRVTSLSGGGIALVVQQPLPKQVLLRVPLELESGAAPLIVNVRPVDIVPLTGGQYLVRGGFVGLAEADEEAITHHIFRKQQHTAAPEAHAGLRPE